MLITGIVYHNDSCEAVNLISSILNSTGKKISIVDCKSLYGLDYSRVKSYTRELEKNNTDVLILKLDLSDADKNFLKYFNFDIIIYLQKTDDIIDEENRMYYDEMKKKLFEALNERGIVIVNINDNELVKYLERKQYSTITYGFNSKACMTTSSIGDTVFKNNFICCLQENISTKSGNIIEPQEYRINVKSPDINAYDVLAAVSFAVVNDIDINNFKQ